MEEGRAAQGGTTKEQEQEQEQQTAPEAAPERVTVSLIPKAANELKTLQTETKMSRSDLVNRAVSLYAFITKQIDAGGELAIHYPDSDKTRIVHIT